MQIVYSPVSTGEVEAQGVRKGQSGGGEAQRLWGQTGDSEPALGWLLLSLS